MNTNNRQQHGFTVIELMVATAVFSVILLLATTGLLYIVRAYYKGITSSATQEVARSVIQDITQDFELTGGYFKQLTPSSNDGFCIGNNMYSYKIDKKTNDPGGPNALVVRSVSGCETKQPDNVITGTDSTGVFNVRSQWRELLGSNMRVHALSATPDTINKPQAISITLQIIAGEDDMIDLATGTCKGSFGTQFCASSKLTTYAIRRLKVN